MPSCTCRLGRDVLPIIPKLALPSVTPGCPSWGVLNRLKASARNSRRVVSRIGSRNSRCRDMSVETVPGPIRMLRPELPCTYCGGNTKAEVSNQRPTVGLSSFWLAIRFGQLVLPVLALSKFRLSVDATPLERVVMPLSAHPPAIAAPRPPTESVCPCRMEMPTYR